MIFSNFVFMSRIFQLQQFLEESPDDNFLIHALALEFVKEGKEDKAAECFTKNLISNPAYIATYYHYGKLLERTGEPDKAIDIYREGMEIAKAAGDQHAFSELRSVYEDLTY
jgi:tetratricopeptide (TPR) repeat protein